MSTFRIGRRDAQGSLRHAFDLAQRDDGGVLLKNQQGSVLDVEKHALFEHFAAPREGVTGGLRDGVLATWMQRLEPGTKAHFESAVRDLPVPFDWMGVA